MSNAVNGKPIPINSYGYIELRPYVSDYNANPIFLKMEQAYNVLINGGQLRVFWHYQTGGSTPRAYKYWSITDLNGKVWQMRAISYNGLLDNYHEQLRVVEETYFADGTIASMTIEHQSKGGLL